ncbi:MAG: hypothetical protein QW112_02360 [Candidatus Micrarchaeia archaeon]
MSETRSKKEMMARIREAKSVSEIVGLFKNRELAEFILNVVEDSRVDYKNLAEYPGFEADYERILNSSLERRPSISGMSKRDAIAEAFMQLVIAGRTKEPISPELESIVKPIVAIARSVQTEGATINDSINATIQIYGRLNDLGIKQSSRSRRTKRNSRNAKGESRERARAKKATRVRKERADRRIAIKRVGVARTRRAVTARKRREKAVMLTEMRRREERKAASKRMLIGTGSRLRKYSRTTGRMTGRGRRSQKMRLLPRR